MQRAAASRMAGLGRFVQLPSSSRIGVRRNGYGRDIDQFSTKTVESFRMGAHCRIDPRISVTDQSEKTHRKVWSRRVIIRERQVSPIFSFSLLLDCSVVVAGTIGTCS
jgi:hypothetical protein